MNDKIKIEKYLEAFKSQFKCEESDLAFYGKDNKGIVLNYNNNVYHVVSDLEMDEYFNEILTTDLASNIPVDIWLLIAEDVHKFPAFHNAVTKELNSSELNNYETARELCCFADDPTSAFWTILKETDIDETYSKAINASTKVFDLWSLSCELCDLILVPDSLKDFGAVEFYEVDISESDDEEDAFFYVYRKVNETDFYVYLP